MSVDTNKAAVSDALERLSAGDVDRFVSMLAPNYVRHCQAMPAGMQELRGPDAMKTWLLANKVSFPDYREDVDMLVGEGDFVAWRSTGTGTLLGQMGPFPATGRRMSITIIGMHRFENGKVAETWTSWDNVAALAQLGLMPGAPAQP
jgi:steroid delta-isomerase-like uncharacterized protein